MRIPVIWANNTAGRQSTTDAEFFFLFLMFHENDIPGRLGFGIHGQAREAELDTSRIPRGNEQDLLSPFPPLFRNKHHQGT